jgi:hypothetical protein
MPFPRYAALCWPIHLSPALSKSTRLSPNDAGRANNRTPPRPWLPALSQFLTQRSAVTAWVEASWRYDFPPNLSRLIPLFVDLEATVAATTPEGRELRWVIQGVGQLNDALQQLRLEFGAKLALYPGLVWRGGLHGGAGRSFWSVWDERRGCVVESLS